MTVLDVGLIALTAGGAAWAAGGATVGTAAVTTVEAGTAIPAIMRIDGAMILRLLRPLGTWSVFGVSVFGVAKYVKVLDPISRFVSASTLTYEIYGAGGAGVDEVKTLSGFGVEINTSLCEIDRREIREDKIKAGLAKIPRP